MDPELSIHTVEIKKENIYFKYGMDTCRICLLKNRIYCSLYDYCDEEKTSIDEMITSICSIDMQGNDNFPNQICCQCFNDLRFAYSFRRKCLTNDEVLKKQLIAEIDIKEELIDESSNVHSESNMNYSENTLIETTPDFTPYKKDSESEIIYPNSYTTPINHGLGTSFNYPNEPKVQDIWISSFTKKWEDMQHAFKQKSFINDNNALSNIGRDEKLFKCNICNYAGKTEGFLRRHMTKHNTSTKTYPCTVCDYIAKTNDRLKNHLLTHDTTNKYACDNCDFVCNAKRYIYRHMIKHMAAKKYSCSDCDYTCNAKRYLYSHMITHADEKRFGCPLCPFSAKRNNELKLHTLMRHTDVKAYACDTCDYVGKTRNCLAKHAIKHQDEKKYTCDVCNYACRKKYDLRRHKLTHDGGGVNVFRCKSCSFATDSREHLKLHVRDAMHPVGVRYNCERCDYVCDERRYLAKHMLVHTDVKKHACRLCDYTAKRSDEVKRHVVLKHTAEKKYSCTVCSYASKVGCDLKRHMKRHSIDSQSLSTQSSFVGV